MDLGDRLWFVRERHLAEPALRDAVASLSDAGLSVLVENAGQGGLSLPDLAGLPVSGLKLGPALVGRIDEDDPRGLEVARSLVILAHGLGWRSLAVGVETDHQRAVLFGFGIDAVQGYGICRPLPLENLIAEDEEGVLATTPQCDVPHDSIAS